MDYRNYNRCRQFTPPGWGTARTLAPCGRADRAVQFRLSECRPTLAPIILPCQGGMNTAREGVSQEIDPAHGRRFCPPVTQPPINVQLKMCPVGDNRGNMGGQGQSGQCNRWQGGGGGQGGYGGGDGISSGGDDYCAQCPNICPLPRCPPGIKVERTLPIIPRSTFLQSTFKMPSASVYKSDYAPKELEFTKSYAPERVVAESSGEFEPSSVYKVDYPSHPVCPYQKPPWSFDKPREDNLMKMNGISCYKIDYVPKKGNPAPSAKPERFIDAEAPSMDDRTVYQVEYIEHPLPERIEKLSKSQIIAEVSAHCLPFDGTTIYKQDYIPKKGKPAESVLKEAKFMRKLLPMDNTTTYKSSYEPFYFTDMECIPADIYDEMYPPQDKCCSVRCFPEADRVLENPVQPPRPPCPQPQPGSYCPTPQEMLCAPKLQPCIPQYTLKKENTFGNSMTIRVEPNLARQYQNDPVEYVCEKAPPCKPSF